jgi:hypothetical protein
MTAKKTTKKTEKTEPKKPQPKSKAKPKAKKEEITELDLEEIMSSIRDSTLKKNGHVDHCSCTGCGDAEFDYEDEDCDCCCGGEEDEDAVVVVFNKTSNDLWGPFTLSALEDWLEETQEDSEDELFVLKIDSVAKLSLEWACDEAEVDDLF